MDLRYSHSESECAAGPGEKVNRKKYTEAEAERQRKPIAFLTSLFPGGSCAR